MPPGRVLDSRSTTAQGDKEAQFSSAANRPAAHAMMTEHAGPDCKRNKLHHEQPNGTEGGACASWQRRRVRNHCVMAEWCGATTTFLLQGGVSASLSARRLDPRRHREEITYAAAKHSGAKMGVNARVLGVRAVHFETGRWKVPTGDTIDTIPTPPLDSAHLSALGWLSASPGTHPKYGNVLTTCLFSTHTVPRCRAF